jgi:O-antigen ligase
MNNEVFGHLNVVLTFLAMVNLKDESFWDRVLSFLAFSAGTYIVLLNETRGAWIAYCILLIVSIYYLYRSKAFSSTVISLIALSFVLLVALALNTGSVKERVNFATTEAQEWMAGEKDIGSSIGLRLEMWTAGIRSIENIPLFGYGNHNANVVAANYSDDRVKNHIASLNHLHNDYLNHFISKGLLGLLSVVGLLLLPLFVARSGPEIGYLIGVTLSVSYSVFALFNVVFGDVFMNAFYVFFVSIIIAFKKEKNINKV